MIDDLARANVRFVDDTAHAAPMVAVRVRVDHRRHRQPFADVLLEQRERCARRFRRGQRVDHDPALLAAHERNVGEVEAAHLIDARNHFVQTVVHVQHRDAVQRRIDAVETRAAVQELEAIHVPGNVPVIRHDLGVFRRRNESLRLLLEVALVGERQRGGRLLQHFFRERRRWFSLRIEVCTRLGSENQGAGRRNGEHQRERCGESHAISPLFTVLSPQTTASAAAGHGREITRRLGGSRRSRSPPTAVRLRPNKTVRRLRSTLPTRPETRRRGLVDRSVGVGRSRERDRSGW